MARVYERSSSFGVGNLKVFESFTQQKDGAIFGAIFEELSFFCFVLGGSLQNHVRSIDILLKPSIFKRFCMVSNSEDINFMVQPLSRLFLRKSCLQGAGSRCPTEPEKAANCQTAKPPTAVVQRCDVIVVDLSCNHESGRGIRHLCRCVMLADFLKDCH